MQFEQCGLRDRSILCGQLQFSDRKMVALLAALLSPAYLVLLDEPFAGLDSNRIDSAVEAIRAARSPGKAIILVEHGIRRLLSVVDTIIVLDQGRVVASGAMGASEVEASLAALHLV